MKTVMWMMFMVMIFAIMKATRLMTTFTVLTWQERSGQLAIMVKVLLAYVGM